MTTISRLNQFIDANSVTAGPQGPGPMSAQYLASLRHPLTRFMLESRIRRIERGFALGSTITAVALNCHLVSSFDPQIVQMPVFWQHAPLGIQESRARIVRALVHQRVAASCANCAQLLGLLILLGGGQPKAAWRMAQPLDGQSMAHQLLAPDLVIGLIVYGVVLCVEGAADAAGSVRAIAATL